MNDKVENLILEHLRIMRADIGRIEGKVDTLGAEMLILRQHMAGLVGSETLHNAEIAGIKVRLDRIERRLELVD